MTREQEVKGRLVEVARRALNQTQSGSMRWRSTDDDDAFIFSGSRTSLIVDFIPRAAEYVLRVLNQNGTAIGELKSEWTLSESDDPWSTPERKAATWNSVLEGLYSAARHSALDVDAMLEATLKDLDDLDTF
jgi:hypothetical protein